MYQKQQALVYRFEDQKKKATYASQWLCTHQHIRVDVQFLLPRCVSPVAFRGNIYPQPRAKRTPI